MLFRSSTPAPDRFPDVEGVPLDGEPLLLPRDLKAPWNLLIVLFDDTLDPLADKWVMLGRRLADGSGGHLDVYELPVVGKGWRLFRPMVREAMKAQADDADERARTVPVHQDRKAFRKLLGVRDKDTVHVFLVARDGRIAWRGHGLMTPDQVSALEKAVGESVSGHAPHESPPTSAPDRPRGEGLPDVG